MLALVLVARETTSGGGGMTLVSGKNSHCTSCSAQNMSLLVATRSACRNDLVKMNFLLYSTITAVKTKTTVATNTPRTNVAILLIAI